MISLTSREFNQDTSLAKRSAMNGPVFITDRGRPAHVLLSVEDYNRLTASQNIVDLLACPKTTDTDFEPACLHSLLNPVEFD